MTVKIRGTIPLLMEKMDMTVVDIYDKMKGRKMIQKDAKQEEEMCENKIHYTENGNIGFPAAGFAKGMVAMAPYIEGLDMKRVRGSVRVIGNVIPIDFKERTTNITYGKTSGMTKSPRKIMRPEFKDWSCKLDIMFNANNISPEQIINLINWAGFQQGIGGWRPEHNGSYGQYEVVP
jgi:hypothetical protein